MENNRRYYANKARTEFIQLQTYIRQASDAIDRLRKENSEFARNKVEQLRIKLDGLEKSKDEKEQEEKDIRSGLRDEIINQEIKTNTNLCTGINSQSSRKKIETDKQDEENKNLSKNYQKSIRNDSRKQRQYYRDIKYEYRHYLHAVETIPEYIIRNLKEMPHNRGYIWRGVYLFGELPVEYNRPYSMFEKLRGGILRIHEWDEYSVRIYEKKGKDRKYLVSEKPRRKINGLNRRIRR